MKWISTTIKMRWMYKILAGFKKIEFKDCNKFWESRLDKYAGKKYKPGELGIVFVCGQDVFRYSVTAVYRHKVKEPIKIDKKSTNEYYAIHLGDRIG